MIHCASEEQARQVRDGLAARLAKVGLELYPDKTRIVYCKDADRRGSKPINDTFKGQLNLEQHGGHTPAGVWVRVVQRVLALTGSSLYQVGWPRRGGLTGGRSFRWLRDRS